MYRIVVLFVVYVFCSVSCFAQALKQKLERLMDSYGSSYNGAVFVAKRGGTLLDKGYGYRDAAKKIANTESSIFRIGQVSEIITAEVILQLDSKGKLGLDDKIVKYLPDYLNGYKVSIRNLLTHSSGIYDYSKDTVLSNMYGTKPIRKQTIMASFSNRKLVFDPGSRFEYSASDYFLLGCIIEQIMKWGYTDQVRDKIFQGCGMNNSGFDFAHLNDPNKAVGYQSMNGGSFKEAPLTDSSALYAWGDIYSTTGDLYKFNRELHWYKLLPKDWQELAYTPLRGQEALGWKIESIYNKRFMEKEGNIPGFSSLVMRQEEDDLFIVLLENTSTPAVPLSTIAAGILKSIYGAEPKKTVEKATEKDESSPNEELLKKYVGEFDFSPTFFLIFKLSANGLTVETPDRRVLPMIAETNNRFSIKGSVAKIEFIKDKKGNVNKVILRQKGQESTGERIER